MNVDNLIAEARSKVSGRVPRYIDINAAIALARQEIVDMTVERVQSAMEQAILGAQSILRSTCEEYIEALYVNDNLEIAIREEAEHLETGYDQRQMLDDMLDSPKAKMSAKGNMYLVVPVGKKPESNVVKAITTKTADLVSQGKLSGASSRTLDQMVSDMRSLANRSKAVATAPRSADPSREFRTATESQDSTTQWVHPGFQGVNQLEFINSQLKSDLQESAVRLLEAAIDRMRK